MANQEIDGSYSEVLRILEKTDPADASVFNPLFNRLINNDANLDDKIQTKAEKPSNVDTASVGQVLTKTVDGSSYQDPQSGGTDGNIPAGGIIMWNGSIISIPVGWALCDGLNGTPDLTDRFVVGAGGSYSVNDIGGTNEVTLSVDNLATHTHTGTTDNDSHSHGGSTNTAGQHDHTTSVSFTFSDAQSGSDIDDVATSGIGTTSNAGDHNHTISTDSDSHSHSLNINNSGSNTAHENRPPYYALAYIMKL